MVEGLVAGSEGEAEAVRGVVVDSLFEAGADEVLEGVRVRLRGGSGSSGGRSRGETADLG